MTTKVWTGHRFETVTAKMGRLVYLGGAITHVLETPRKRVMLIVPGSVGGRFVDAIKVMADRMGLVYCPSCRMNTPKLRGQVRYCPGCGKKFDDPSNEGDFSKKVW